MLELLWINLLALGAASVVAVLDVDVEVGRYKIGRPTYGVLVLGGLVAAYALTVQEGALPVPAYGILLFAALYLPFLSHSFVDLELTDRLARRELEELLLSRTYLELRNASGQDVLREDGRKLRVHWEVEDDDGDGILVELDVHPSLLPVSVSRPHVATVHNQSHLEQIRDDIRHRRAQRGR